MESLNFKIEYDVELLPTERRDGPPEANDIKNFVEEKGPEKRMNMVITYDSPEIAKARRLALYNKCKRQKWDSHIKLYRRKNVVVIDRKIEEKHDERE